MTPICLIVKLLEGAQRERCVVCALACMFIMVARMYVQYVLHSPMFCGIRMYYVNSITLKDMCSISYIDYVQIYRLTVVGEYCKQEYMFGNFGHPAFSNAEKTNSFYFLEVILY